MVNRCRVFLLVERIYGTPVTEERFRATCCLFGSRSPCRLWALGRSRRSLRYAPSRASCRVSSAPGKFRRLFCSRWLGWLWVSRGCWSLTVPRPSCRASPGTNSRTSSRALRCLLCSRSRWIYRRQRFRLALFRSGLSSSLFRTSSSTSLRLLCRCRIRSLGLSRRRLGSRRTFLTIPLPLIPTSRRFRTSPSSSSSSNSRSTSTVPSLLILLLPLPLQIPLDLENLPRHLQPPTPHRIQQPHLRNSLILRRREPIMQQLRFIPVSHGVWCFVCGAGIKEGLELGDGRAAVEVVVGGFDVEAVDGE